MKRFVPLALVGAVLLSVTGCGGPDALMREFVVNLNALAETVEKKESKERIQAAADRVKATQEKIDKLKLSDGEKDGLKKKYESDLKSATERYEKARSKAALEGGSDPAPHLDLPKLDGQK